MKHLNEAPEPFANACPELGIPHELEAVVFRCLEKSRAARFQNIDELKETLELLLDSTPVKRKQILAHKVWRAKWRQRIGKLEKPVFLALCLGFAITLAATHSFSDATKYDTLQMLVNRAKLADFSSWNSGADWVRAVEEGERIHASDTRMIDIYNRTGEAFRLWNREKAREVWQKALKLLERSHESMADRIEDLLQNKNSQALEWSENAIASTQKIEHLNHFEIMEAYEIHFEALKRLGRNHEIATRIKQLIVQNTDAPIIGHYTSRISVRHKSPPRSK